MSELPVASQTGECPARDPFRAVYENARLLIVDDELPNIAMLEDALQQVGYFHIKSTQDPFATLDLYRTFAPDIVLLDLMMPGLDGFGVLDQIRAAPGHERAAPILVLTADISPQSKRLALTKGANDFLTKPFDIVELMLRIQHLLENRFLHLDLRDQNLLLEERVRVRTADLAAAQDRILSYTRELEEAHREMMDRLAHAGEFRDDDTGRHTQRVAHTTALLAEKLGFDAEHVGWIQQAARLHDVGKIGVSDLILLKPGKLTDEEFAVMKTHTEIGAKLFEDGRSDLVQIAQRIARSHHERWDGRGYPDGLAGEAIPLEGRILAVADVFDALTHDRPYKKAWPVADAVAEIQRGSGTQFDAAIVALFCELDHATLI